MTDNKPMEVLKKQLMNYLIERKCAKNNQDNYRYALNGMIDYCNRNNDGYYSDEAIAKYVFRMQKSMICLMRYNTKSSKQHSMKSRRILSFLSRYIQLL